MPRANLIIPKLPGDDLDRCSTFSGTGSWIVRTFGAAKEQSAIVMTKDADFVRLLEELGPPPKIIWITCGNTSNAHLKQLLQGTLPRAMKLIAEHETLVEVSDLRSESS